jgi:hypothetical protein
MCTINANEVHCRRACQGDKECRYFWLKTPMVTLWDESSVYKCDNYWQSRVLWNNMIEYHECIYFEVLMGKVEKLCPECDARLNPPITVGWWTKVRQAWETNDSEDEGWQA